MDILHPVETIAPVHSDILTVSSTGALKIPIGTTAQAPADEDGLIRFNTDTNRVEWNDGTQYNPVGTSFLSSLTVTGSTGLTVGGSPLTTSGTISLTLSSELQSLSTLSSTGLMVRTAADTYSAVSILGTVGRITVTGGDGTSNPTIDLATVGTPVSNQFLKITTDAYGRVTGTAAVSSGDLTTTLGYTPVNKAGDTMSGLLILSGDPVVPLGAATKQYVDANIQGLTPKPTVRLATAVALPSNSYDNGTLGEGATLAANNNGALSVDGDLVAVNDIILVKDEALAQHNGLYVVTATGSAGTPYVLTRHADMNLASEVSGAFVPVSYEGTENANTLWLANPSGSVTLGTTAIPFTQLNGATDLTAGNGISISGNIISASLSSRLTFNGSAIDLASGVVGGSGTGTFTKVTVDTYGRVIGTATATPADIGAIGSITINSLNGFSGSSSGGSTPTLTLTTTVNGIVKGNGTSLSAATVGTDYSAGTASLATGLLKSTTVTGVLSTADAGTDYVAPSAYASNNGLTMSTNRLLGRTTISSGAAEEISVGAGLTLSGGTLTGTGGTVTSVGLSLPSIFNVTVSPITTSGTLTASLSNQAANTVLVAPNGSAGTPSFRNLIYADLPIKLYSENPSSPLASTASGANSIVIGNGSSATANNAIALGESALSSSYGCIAHASGSFSTAGDAQASSYVLRAATTNNAWTEVFLNGVDARLVLKDNSVVVFTVVFAAHRTDAVGGSAGFKLEGVIKRDSGVATVALVGNNSVTTIGRTNGSWDVNVVPDLVNGAMSVKVKGETGKSIRWVASVQTVEVTS